MPGSDMCLEPVAKNEMVNTTDVVCSGVLKDLSMAPLRRLWHQRMGRGKDPPGIRSLLLRELAWHDQQAVKGGMDAQTRALLRLAIRLASKVPTRPRNSLRKRSRLKPNLKTGTKLIRTWRGRKHEVIVLDDGSSGGRGRFEYAGETFRGLTAIAQKITGAHWSGPRFFGLNRVRSIR